MSYVVHSIVQVPIEKVEETVAIYQNRSKLVDEYDGFLSFQLLQNEKKPSELTVQLTWETKEAYMNWATSEAFQKVHDLEKNYPDQELAAIVPKVKKYRVVAT